MFRKDYSNKKITFFAVMRKDDSNKNILTIVSSVNNAMEYIETAVKAAHFDHFESWAELKGLDIADEAVWDKYSATCIDLEEYTEYIITKMEYKNSDVAAMLRIFAHSLPLGCSYENILEREKFEAQLEIKKAIVAAWDKVANDKSLDDITKKAQKQVAKELEDMANDEVDEDESE